MDYARLIGEGRVDELETQRVPTSDELWTAAIRGDLSVLEWASNHGVHPNNHAFCLATIHWLYQKKLYMHDDVDPEYIIRYYGTDFRNGVVFKFRCMHRN